MQKNEVRISRRKRRGLNCHLLLEVGLNGLRSGVGHHYYTTSLPIIGCGIKERPLRFTKIVLGMGER